MDSNHRRYQPADLQSAPFGHSGNCPYIVYLRTPYAAVPQGLQVQEKRLQM